MACAGAASLVLALALGEHDLSHNFDVIRLAAYGVFLHGPVLLGLSAVVFWRMRRYVFASACALGCTGMITVTIDAFLIEPTQLEVSHVRIASPKITRPIKIVLLADLQTDHIGRYEQDVFRRIAEEKPDLCLLAGDYLQSNWEEREDLRASFRPLLRELSENGLASGGRIVAIQGNIDLDDWEEMFDQLDGDSVKAVSSTQSFDFDPVQLTCLGLRASYDPSLKIAPAKDGRFHIVLGHCPDYALGRIDADLLLAGHTHGGQVCLPWIGPLITNSRLPRRHASGMTELPSGARLLVSRGVGMERGKAPRLRFLCKPELVVIELVPD